MPEQVCVLITCSFELKFVGRFDRFAVVIPSHLAAFGSRDLHFKPDWFSLWRQEEQFSSAPVSFLFVYSEYSTIQHV